MKPGVIFDMDGLLFDTEDLYAQGWLEVGERLVGEANEDMANDICGTNGTELKNVVLSYYPDVDVDYYYQEVQKRVYQLFLEGVPKKPGCEEILSYAKEQGCKIALASSSNMNYIDLSLDTHDLRKYFDVIINRDHVTNGKPDPEMFLKAAQALNLSPEDCYVIEDSIPGVQAGLAAGCATIMVPDRKKPLPEFYEQCEGVYETLLDVVAAWKEQNSA